MSDVWYFAYGSNMSRAIFCERRGMCPRESRWGWLEDHRLCFDLPVGPGERGVANVEVAAGARTCGVLYLVDATELDRLDRTEGVHVGLYERVLVDVLAQDGIRVPAYTYRSTWSYTGRKPSARYLGLLLSGAREHGLPPEYVRSLEAWELAWDEREGDRPPDVTKP
ncbi:MAG TPA: gamma-glutamylcyclotransferase family protein [Candidatus Binatia bacterium]|nr:gamma-glutamylcyclotransferase family protein [Candidatus Binatia bacterium]